jgi:hypothetical protein
MHLVNLRAYANMEGIDFELPPALSGAAESGFMYTPPKPDSAFVSNAGHFGLLTPEGAPTKSEETHGKA